MDRWDGQCLAGRLCAGVGSWSGIGKRRSVTQGEKKSRLENKLMCDASKLRLNCLNAECEMIWNPQCWFDIRRMHTIFTRFLDHWFLTYLNRIVTPSVTSTCKQIQILASAVQELFSLNLIVYQWKWQHSNWRVFAIKNNLFLMLKSYRKVGISIFEIKKIDKSFFLLHNFPRSDGRLIIECVCLPAAVIISNSGSRLHASLRFEFFVRSTKIIFCKTEWLPLKFAPTHSPARYESDAYFFSWKSATSRTE